MLKKDDIMKIIPHRPPFLWLDELTVLEPGKRASGSLTITGEEEFFKGHFPGNPVMPGVLIIEALAQCGACAVLSMEEFRGKTGYFTGIDGARFKRKVRPCDTLTLEVELIKIRGPLGVGKAVAWVGSEKAAQAELTFVVG